MPFRASAPGSLILLGEYAVLYGKKALVCAVNQRIHVTLSPRADHQIEIFSHHYPHTMYSATIQELTVQRPFQFVLGVLQQYHAQLKQGCTIEIESEFSDQVGLGSSAAVTVATLAALFAWLEIRVPTRRYVEIGRLIVHTIQGMGSGADLAASSYGGLVSYRAWPLTIEQHAAQYPLTVLYSGFKTPTSIAVQQVQQAFIDRPQVLQQLCEQIDDCVSEGLQLINQDACLSRLGAVLVRQNALLVQLGVSMPRLQQMVDSLCAQPGIFGAKISGAGLGDCVVGLGSAPHDYVYPAQREETTPHHTVSTSRRATALFPNSTVMGNQVQRLPVNMTTRGVYCETI